MHITYFYKTLFHDRSAEQPVSSVYVRVSITASLIGSVQTSLVSHIPTYFPSFQLPLSVYVTINIYLTLNQLLTPSISLSCL